MPKIFPEPITKLPEADIPIAGLKTYLSQSATHQVLFMQFDEDVDLPEHSHKAQHSAKIFTGYADITFFDEPDRYSIKE